MLPGMKNDSEIRCHGDEEETAGNCLIWGGWSESRCPLLAWGEKKDRRTLEFTAGTCSGPFIHSAGCVARRSARHPLSSAHRRVSSPGQVRHPSKLLCYAIVWDLCTVCILPACALQRTDKSTALLCSAQVPYNVWDEPIPREAPFTSIYPHFYAFLKKVKNQQPTVCSLQEWNIVMLCAFRRAAAHSWEKRDFCVLAARVLERPLPFIQELAVCRMHMGLCAYL